MGETQSLMYRKYYLHKIESLICEWNHKNKTETFSYE